MAKRLEGLKIAVIGLGRSGLGVARAAFELGASATVFDSKPEAALAKPELATEARSLGIPLEFGWSEGLPRGYNTIVVNPAVDPRSEVYASLLAAGIPIWSEVEFAYRISIAPIIGITGTNGKSTTTVMTYLALDACNASPILCGNLFGSGYPEMTLTDAALIGKPDQVLVAEISSFQLEQVESFKPVAASITNIAPDHQDRYDRYEDYVAAKQRIFEFQTKDDYAVVPDAGLGVTAPTDGPQVLTFGLEQGDAFVHQSSLIVLGERGELPFQEPHNLLNAGSAALLTTAYLSSRDGELKGRPEIFQGLKKFRGLAHRMESVGKACGIWVVNNSMCTNPDAVISSSAPRPERQHLLIGGVNKGLNFSKVGVYLNDRGHAAYLFGRDREAISEQLGTDWPQFETMAEAFRAATTKALPGESIMLAPGCASSDQFRDFRERGDVFRAEAQAWIKEQGGSC